MAFAGCDTSSTSTDTSPDESTEETPDEEVDETVDEGEPQYGGKLRLLMPQLQTYGNIKTTFNVGGTNYLFPCCETLVGVDENGIAPTKLATGWDIDPNGEFITFTLREGVKFHDGTDFNAEAVKWNLDQIRDLKEELHVIESIDVLDDYKVRLNLSEYSNTLLYHFTWYDGIMISPASVEGQDDEYIANNVIGTGPFVLKEWNKDTNAVFTRFSEYWDEGKPYLDELEFIATSDDNTARNALLSGQADVWEYVLDVNIARMKEEGYEVNTVPGLVRVMHFDSANPDSPFAKKEVRYAIEHAIDKEAIAEAFGLGNWEVPFGPCAPSVHMGCSSCMGDARRYDPEKAKELLAEAGYADGFDMTIYSVRSIDDELIDAVQGYLLAVGINAEIQKPDSATMSSLRSEGWQNGVLLQGLSCASPSYVEALQSDGPSPTKAASVYRSQEYLDLLAEAAAATDTATEKALTEQLVQLVQEEANMIAIAVQSRPCVYDPKVHFDLNDITVHFWNPGDAWMEQ